MAERSDDINACVINALASIERLYDKAIHSPSEITQEEKHAIMLWPSLEQMEETTQKYVGKSLQDLIHTAANDPLSLTYAECRLMKDDFRILGSIDGAKHNLDRLQFMIERGELWQKGQRARAAILSPDELKALENINLPEILEMEKAHQKPITEARERAITHPPDWVQRILDREGKGWGYVIYRPSVIHEEEGTKEAWRACWENFDDLLDYQPGCVKGADEIHHSKITDFVDYGPEKGGVDRLRKDFRDRRGKGSLKPGVLSNVFMLVSTECRDSYFRDRYSWAWAVDPDWSLPGPDADGYDGRVKVTGAQFWNKLYDLMSTQKATLKEIWEEFHELNEKLPDGPVPGWAFSKLPKRVWPDY